MGWRHAWAFSNSGRSLRKACTKRTCGTRVAGLRLGRLRAVAAPFPEPQIQDSKLNGLATCLGILQFGSQPAEGAHEADLRDTSCGPPPGRLRPARSYGPISNSTRDQPAAERTGLRPLGAALRPGAAAGCRSLRDRFCRQTLPPKSAASVCREPTDLQSRGE